VVSAKSSLVAEINLIIYFMFSYLFEQKDLTGFEYFQIFSVSNIWYKEKKNDIATFDLYIRDLPENRNFYVLGGINEIVENIIHWKYKDEDIKILLKHKVIDKDFALYLKNFSFSGNLYAMKEGTIFFPNEPIVRVEAPATEGNLFTLFLINTITSNTLFLTKVVRVAEITKPKILLGIYGTRSQSFESSLKSMRASYIAGNAGFNLPTFFTKYKIPFYKNPINIAYHAYIKSFDNELLAMRTFVSYFPKGASLMIDTYDINSGIKNAVKVAKELEQIKQRLYGVIIDSGDLYNNCLMVRKYLDKFNLKYVKITLASNLDEYKIDYLIRKNTPADSFLVVTEGVTVADAPKLEVVYKMAKIQHKNKIRHTIKLAKNKVSLPGDKQVFRLKNKDGKYYKDIIGLNNENLGEKLLIKFISNGKLTVKNLPNLDQIKNYLSKQINSFPKVIFNIKKNKIYKIQISKNLKKLFIKVKKEILLN